MAADSKAKIRAQNADPTNAVQGTREQLTADIAEFKLMFTELRELRQDAWEAERKREDDAA